MEEWMRYEAMKMSDCTPVSKVPELAIKIWERKMRKKEDLCFYYSLPR